MTGTAEGTRALLGVLVITRDEEANIARCLDSVRFADEIVVVDSGSTDRTVEIARGLGAEVYEVPWRGYSAQKQFALDRLTASWVLWIDADEAVSPPLRAEIERVVSADPPVSGYFVPRLVFYLGRRILHGGWYPDPKLRLFRRSAGRFDGRLVHEGVEVKGPLGTLVGPLHHYPYRDEAHHREKIETYARLAAEQLRVDGKRSTPLDMALRPVLRFCRMWIWQGGFLDGRPGWVAARMGARYVARKYRYARAEGARERA